MGTKRGLFEEPRNKLVILYVVDILLLEGALPASDLEAELRVHIIGRVLLIAVLLVVRHFEGRESSL